MINFNPKRQVISDYFRQKKHSCLNHSNKQLIVSSPNPLQAHRQGVHPPHPPLSEKQSSNLQSIHQTTSAAFLGSIPEQRQPDARKHSEVHSKNMLLVMVLPVYIDLLSYWNTQMYTMPHKMSQTDKLCHPIMSTASLHLWSANSQHRTQVRSLIFTPKHQYLSILVFTLHAALELSVPPYILSTIHSLLLQY